MCNGFDIHVFKRVPWDYRQVFVIDERCLQVIYENDEAIVNCALFCLELFPANRQRVQKSLKPAGPIDRSTNFTRNKQG
jgi:hypothetical protein